MQTLFCQVLRAVGAVLVVVVTEYIIERCLDDEEGHETV